MKTSQEPSRVLDLTGLKCPLPALKARKALARMPAGAALAVLTDDPMAGIDIPHMCREEGHAVVDSADAAGGRRFVIVAEAS